MVLGGLLASVTAPHRTHRKIEVPSAAGFHNMYRPGKPFEQEPWATLLWAVAVCLVAAGTFFLAYENGSYSISQRETLAALVWWTLAIGTLVGLLPRATPAA